MTSIEQNIEALPKDSPYRIILRGLHSDDPSVKDAGQDALRSLPAKRQSHPPMDETTVLIVLRSLLSLPVPLDRSRLRDVRSTLFKLIGSAHPSVIDLIKAQFASVDPRLHQDLLTVVASAVTREGAECFVQLVQQHDSPKDVHQRFSMELNENYLHGDVLFPALLDVRNGPAFMLGELLLLALRGKTLDVSRVQSSPWVSSLPARIKKLLQRQAEVRTKDRDTLDDVEASVVHELGLLFDVAGFLSDDKTLPLLTEGLALPETWCACFATASLLRRGIQVPDQDIERIAKDHTARATFYSVLKELEAHHRIPAALRSEQAFAAANMVHWLSHPGELGRAPDELELMEVFKGQQNGTAVSYYVWRFRQQGKPWMASISGPYPAEAPEGPLHGSDTFSRFEEWDSASAEQHAEAILKNLAEWERAWSEGRWTQEITSLFTLCLVRALVATLVTHRFNRIVPAPFQY